MRICTLASGSSGNAVFVESADTRILIDAGLSCRELELRLRAIGVEPDTIDAAVFTHEHADHVRGAGTFGRRYKKPLYFNPATRKAVGNLGKCTIAEFGTGEPFEIGGLQLEPFSVSHDAVDPVGFAVNNGTARLGYAADVGVATRLVIERLREVDVLLIESNHDPYLLQIGPYPQVIKQRVSGKRGHLSNGECADLLGTLIHDRLQAVVLIHLSETNNTPDLALDQARHRLDAAGAKELPLIAAGQGTPGPVLDIGLREK